MLSISDEKLNGYALQTASTAIYPDCGNNPVYPTLGLLGESIELLSKIHEKAQSDVTHAEIGDVCWYLARLASELNTKLSETLQSPAMKLEINNLGSLDTCVTLVKAAGEIAEEIKKSIRDNDGIIDPARRERILAHLGEMLRLLDHLSKNLNTTLEKVMSENLAKLASRKERNKLSGSGDKR